MDSNAIEQEALRLSLEDRAQLAQKLRLSLDALSEEERDDVWLTEATAEHASLIVEKSGLFLSMRSGGKRGRC